MLVRRSGKQICFFLKEVNMRSVLVVILIALSTSISAQSFPEDIVFSGNDRIYVIRADGTGQTAITSQAPDTNRPRWSRDGRQIVFTKGNVLPDFNSTVWKMDADGS